MQAMNKSDRNRPGETISRLRKVVDESPFFCKIIELILCVVAVGLIVDPFQSEGTKPDVNRIGLINVSLCGYVLINGVIILCYLIGERQPKKMAMIFSSLGAILSLASAIVLIHDWNKLQDSVIHSYYKRYSDQMIASGIFALLASIIFLVDVILTNKYE